MKKQKKNVAPNDNYGYTVTINKPCIKLSKILQHLMYEKIENIFYWQLSTINPNNHLNDLKNSNVINSS